MIKVLLADDLEIVHTLMRYVLEKRVGMEAGACGNVLKNDMGYELAAAVRSLHQGNRYFSKHVAALAQKESDIS